MILTLRRTGGFAGIRESLGTVDSAHLDGAAQRALAAQVKALDRLASGSAGPGADQFHYEVEVRESGQPPRTLIVADEGNPDSPAFQALMALMGTLGLAVS
ncbi:MAG TPA: protealysin inhibitor emfourin [Geothrix sp.]|jgi:hypothetical protein